MKPESKLPTSGWEDSVFENPVPNQKAADYPKDKRERNSADKVYDNEE